MVTKHQFPFYGAAHTLSREVL